MLGYLVDSARSRLWIYDGFYSSWESGSKAEFQLLSLPIIF
jgi:hypothetical protein